MKRIFPGIPLLGFMILMYSSCVSPRLLEETKSKLSQCEEERNRLKAESQDLNTRNTEMNVKIADFEKRNKALENDTSVLGTSLRKMTSAYNEINRKNDEILAKYEKLLSMNNDETKKVIGQLQLTQEDLQKKEDALKKMERDLAAKEKTLNETSAMLQAREARVAELQGILNRKDSIVNALKNTVAEALLGFKDKGLTVEQKNGKVYVSLEERLLFASGSTVVDKKGEEALKQLAKVLERNQDINVLIEGHTDDVPITGGALKDNWDLSVMRATSIVRILTAGVKVDPRRLTAAGRGEYMPIDPGKTADARKKNRRTEIILTPKLDELLKILETN